MKSNICNEGQHTFDFSFGLAVQCRAQCEGQQELSSWFFTPCLASHDSRVDFLNTVLLKNKIEPYRREMGFNNGTT